MARTHRPNEPRDLVEQYPPSPCTAPSSAPPTNMTEEEWVEYDGGAVMEWHRHARRIRVAPGVTVIPAEAFMDCGNLIALDLSNVTASLDQPSIIAIDWNVLFRPLPLRSKLGKMHFLAAEGWRRSNSAV